MISLGMKNKVFLAIGSTDMRKGINGLSLVVADRLSLDPFSGHLFAFCNQRRNRVKILFWDLCEESGYVELPPEIPFLSMTLALFHLT